MLQIAKGDHLVTTFPGSPRLLKGGLVLLDQDTPAQQPQIITLQYNPDTLSRTLQAHGVGEGADRSQSLRLIGPPVETIKLEAEIDAADQMEFPEENQNVVEYGIHPQLAALETMIYPKSERLFSNNERAKSGELEIVPAEAPLALFVWSKNRIVPVRITEFSVTEEAFDTSLNPIRAKVSLGMRVLNINDFGFDSKGGSLFMIYQQQKETLSRLSKGGSFNDLGIGGIP